MPSHSSVSTSSYRVFFGLFSRSFCYYFTIFCWRKTKKKKHTHWLRIIIMSIRSLVTAFLAAPSVFVNAYGKIHRRNDYAAVPPCTYPYTSFNYVGCYINPSDPNVFALAYNPQLNFKTMTVELCTASCKGEWIPRRLARTSLRLTIL